MTRPKTFQKPVADSSPSGYEDIGYARVDTGREKRKGFPEVIFGEGKTQEQILGIARVLIECGQPLLITRLPAESFSPLRRAIKGIHYHALARCAFTLTPGLLDRLPLAVKRNGRVEPKWREPQPLGFPTGKPSLLVVSAGTLDLPYAEEAALIAALMGCHIVRLGDVGVAGLHRLLAHVRLLREAPAMVVAAGMDAALASVVAGLTDRPVIGLPTPVGYGHGGHGEAALSAMLQSCSPGLTVVNIGNGFGAGFAAAQIALQSRS